MWNRIKSRSGFATSASIWLGCTIGAGALGAAMLVPSGARALPVAAVAAEAGAADHNVFDPNVCVEAFSKDLCEGVLQPGEVNFGWCVSPNGDECQTADVWGASWSFGLMHNAQGCGEGLCDEAIEKDGRLFATIDYTMRLQDPCPYRACFSGTWEYHAEDGTVYKGQVMGTMGVGSHRPSECSFGGRDCEKCMDTTFLPNQEPVSWRIGVEATFQGERVDAPADVRDEICFSLSGDFIAPSDDDGTIRLFEAWDFAGTADGTYVHCN